MKIWAKRDRRVCESAEFLTYRHVYTLSSCSTCYDLAVAVANAWASAVQQYCKIGPTAFICEGINPLPCPTFIIYTVSLCPDKFSAKTARTHVF